MKEPDFIKEHQRITRDLESKGVDRVTAYQVGAITAFGSYIDALMDASARRKPEGGQ